MTLRRWRNVMLCIFLLGLIAAETYAEEKETIWSMIGETTLQGRVVEVNEEHRFVIINLGSTEGVKEGMLLSVFQKDEEVAKVTAKKVRRHITACDIDILFTGRGIGVGDMVIYKQVAPLVKFLTPLEPEGKVGASSIVVDIDAPKHTILSQTLKVLKEFGAVVTGTDTQRYTIQAHKNVEAPIDVALVVDYGPFVRDKIFYTAEVTTTPQYNRLIIRLRGTYDSEGKLYDHEIKKSSAVYRETQEIAFTIKDLSEEM